MQSAEEIQAWAAYHNTGLDQIPGLIVISISDEVEGLVDLDADHELIVVAFNANDEAREFAAEALVGVSLVLHDVQETGSDAIVKKVLFDSESGMISMPARTTAVLVQRADDPTALELMGEPGLGLFWFLPLVK